MFINICKLLKRKLFKMTTNSSALFICKARVTPFTEEYNDGEYSNEGGYSNGDTGGGGGAGGTYLSSGLFNSARYVSSMLTAQGIRSSVVQVVDNNRIHGVVTTDRPSHVFIEALWVVPSKFDVLVPLHPTVKWVIRIHSEIPFIANEGSATQWLFEYVTKPNVYLGFNSMPIYKDFLQLVDPMYKHKVLYLPNHYAGELATNVVKNTIPRSIDIGCFGAIRPMKNQLTQAVAAVEFAKQAGIALRFHINGTRVEQRGESVIKNIRNLFLNSPNCTLVEYPWLNHTDFMNVLSSMDINMQVSLSETFNIVTADAVINDVPVVVSDEIYWVHKFFRVDPTSTAMIKSRLLTTYYTRGLKFHVLNKLGLAKYNIKAKNTWLDYLK
jgi:hypothetical protein